jgi:hypothetical protein
MNFGQAIESIRLGGLVARAGWNGKGMYLYLAEGTENLPRTDAQFSVTVSSPEPLPIASTICMRTAQGTIVPGWLASQTDMLAEDWEVLPRVPSV